MQKRDIIVIGASAGGIEALKTLVSSLPKGFAASIYIVQHIGLQSPGVLPDILLRAGPLAAANARNWETIQPGRIYVAPADHHLLIDKAGYVRITKGPKENRFRPAVDPLFRSAATAFGPRVIAVILTGGLDDGTAGLWAVKQQGGTAIVQDPDDALYPSMPMSALRHVDVDYCLPLPEIAPLLIRLVAEEVPEVGGFPMSEEMEIEVSIAREDKAKPAGVMKLGNFSPYTCPECHGTLIQVNDENPLRFRCHTGHAFSILSLLTELTESVEDTMWAAVRSIEESVMLMRHLADHLGECEQADTATILLQKADEAQQRADLIWQAVMNQEKIDEDQLETLEQS